MSKSDLYLDGNNNRGNISSQNFDGRDKISKLDFYLDGNNNRGNISPQKLDGRDNTIHKLNLEIGSNNDYIDKLKLEIASKDNLNRKVKSEIESKDNQIEKLKLDLKDINNNYIKVNSEYQNIKIKLYNIQKQLYLNNLNDFNKNKNNSKYLDNNIIVDEYDINNFINYLENYILKSSEFHNMNTNDIMKLNGVIDNLEQDTDNHKLLIKELTGEKELLINYYSDLLKEKTIDKEKLQSQLKYFYEIF